MPYTDTTKINSKDVLTLMVNISERTAINYYKEIKDHFDIKIVLYYHFKKYFKIE